MFEIIREAGWGAYPSLIFAGVGVLAIVTVGRRIERAGAMAACFAAAVIASGLLGTATGQDKVSRVVDETADLNVKLALLNEGTKEAHMNLMLSGFLAMAVLGVGLAIAWRQLERDRNAASS
jgi:hypothetical protein